MWLLKPHPNIVFHKGTVMSVITLANEINLTLTFSVPVTVLMLCLFTCYVYSGQSSERWWCRRRHRLSSNRVVKNEKPQVNSEYVRQNIFSLDRGFCSQRQSIKFNLVCCIVTMDELCCSAVSDESLFIVVVTGMSVGKNHSKVRAKSVSLELRSSRALSRDESISLVVVDGQLKYVIVVWLKLFHLQ